ncbi:hypothetical protein B0H63DRAFT_563697 [Podospora didyma]|uniref:Uncharacterized protein n=1 Tax=Podospora didyma TaxID=330526 RepID=A0AAE0K8P9_9PEZI|nr:hypothetical protein B0H63DRAFT_563697 [Podospora didyma]
MDPFIVSTSLDKPGAAARKLIRRHVMRGKNRRNERIPGLTLVGGRPILLPRPAAEKLTATALEGNDENEQSHKRRLLTPAHPQHQLTGADFALTRFADSVEPYMLELVLGYFATVKQSLFPVQMCVAAHPNDSIWFHYLEEDAVYFHALMWSAQSYFDWLRLSSVSPSPLSLHHMAKTLEGLRQRLYEGSPLATSDTTIAVVSTLIMVANLLGYSKSANVHMDGLRKIVMLRGGLASLDDNPLVQLKVCRSDLTTALVTGTKPLFWSDLNTARLVTDTEPSVLDHVTPPPPDLARYWAVFGLSCPQLSVLEIDPRLCEIWCDLRMFCGCANWGYYTPEKVEPDWFQEILYSVEYRLMHPSFPPTEPFNETMRLGLLAVSTTVFLQTATIKVRFEALTTGLRDSLLRMDWSGHGQKALRPWLLFAAGFAAASDVDDYWLMPLLRDALQQAGLDSWEAARAFLKNFIWVDIVHDVEGMMIWEKAVGWNI